MKFAEGCKQNASRFKTNVYQRKRTAARESLSCRFYIDRGCFTIENVRQR